jgi:hypothetical protein
MVTQKIIVSLGILNVLTAAALYFTCRCVPAARFGKELMKHHWYQRFARFHCYLWWVLGASVVVHGTLAIIYFGWPL